MTYVILSCSEYFADLALNEIRRIHPTSSLQEQLSPQNFILKAAGNFTEFTRPWRERLPIYLHHLFPLHRSFSFNKLEKLRSEVQELCPDDYLPQIRTLGKTAYRAREIENFLMPPKPNPQRILSVLIVDKMAYVGISWASQNLSPAPSLQETVSNRAGLKLLEALDSFELRLKPNQEVLDLGAAPGAWTEVLLRRGLKVTAVAPREMYDWLLTNEKLQHFHMTAQDYLSCCQKRFDIMVNDMIMDAQDSARLMLDYAPHLRSGGIVIMTLKLRMRNTRRVIDHSLRILRKEYKIIRLRQLASNRKELTLFLRKKS